MSKWITDRQPVRNDSYEDSVWVMVMGHVVKNYWYNVELGDAWQPIVVETPEPYKPEPMFFIGKEILECNVWHEPTNFDKKYKWYVSCNTVRVADNIPTREAAERIAAIYNEVMP